MQVPSDLVIVCPHLGAGGTQRVITTLTDAWVRQGRRLCVVTLYEHEAVYTLNPAVRIVCIHTMMMAGEGGLIRRLLIRMGTRLLLKGLRERLAGTRIGTWARLVVRGVGGFVYFMVRRVFRYNGEYYYAYRQARTLRRYLCTEAAPVVLAFIGKTNIVTILACRRLARRVVISERNDPARQELDGLWNRLRPVLYGKADVVTANSMHAVETMRRYVRADKLAFLPNPLLLPALRNGRAPVKAEPYILSVGRLHPQKAHDVLLQAIHRLPDHLSAWRLVIVGEGDLRDDLEGLATSLGIAGRVTWTGHVDDPGVYYRDAAIFALPSRHEGTSNALLEAMSYSVPAIVTDVCPGSVELIDDGVEGLVIPVDDPDALAQAITHLAEDEARRRRMGDAARTRVEAFSLPVVLEHWDEVLRT